MKKVKPFPTDSQMAENLEQAKPEWLKELGTDNLVASEEAQENKDLEEAKQYYKD